MNARSSQRDHYSSIPISAASIIPRPAQFFPLHASRHLGFTYKTTSSIFRLPCSNHFPLDASKHTSSEATTLIALCRLHRSPLSQSFVHPVAHNLPTNEADSNHNHPARRRSKKPHHIS